MLPRKRPMDNMAAGWERPQEDEFALMNLGLPSPYRRFAFPNQGGVDMNYLDFAGVSREEIDHWLHVLREFLLAVSVATGRPFGDQKPHAHRADRLNLPARFPKLASFTSRAIPAISLPQHAGCGAAWMTCKRCKYPRSKITSPISMSAIKGWYTAFWRARKTIDPHRLD